MVVKESFLAKQTETVRYSRLQSVSTNNGLIDGFFGLSDLNLYTAENAVYVCGLDQREAFRLREHIATRMIEVSSTGSDALSMTEQGTNAVDSEPAETAPDTTRKLVDSINESGALPWRKFSGWRKEVVVCFGLILLGLPWIPLLLAYVVYTTQFWLLENSENLIGFVLNWYFFLGIWLILSLWIGSGPFIEIPRKGYSVSEDALRYKEG